MNSIELQDKRSFSMGATNAAGGDENENRRPKQTKTIRQLGPDWYE